MKKDFRVQYPLWQMAFIVLLGFMAFGLTGATSELVNTSNEFSYSLQFNPLETVALFGTLFLTFFLLVIFLMKISQHNKQNPTQKITLLQIRPLEYLEQDEGMVHITRIAAQKVYTFFSWALPFIAMIFLVFELSRFWMIISILFVALMQYFIYYMEVRKHLEEEE